MNIARSILLVVFCLVLLSCARRQQEDHVVIGGVVDEKNRVKTSADEMFQRQEKERERQEKELQDIKRQEYYDELYRRYLNQ